MTKYLKTLIRRGNCWFWVWKWRSPAMLGGYDVRVERSFSDWGLMRDFNTCSKSCACFTAQWMILPQLRLILLILTILVLIFSVKTCQRHQLSIGRFNIICESCIIEPPSLAFVDGSSTPKGAASHPLVYTYMDNERVMVVIWGRGWSWKEREKVLVSYLLWWLSLIYSSFITKLNLNL